MEQQRREVAWGPVIPGFAVGLVVSALFFYPGAVLAVVALVALVVKLVRSGRGSLRNSAGRRSLPAEFLSGPSGLLTWFLAGILAGYAVAWVLVGFHALL